MKLEKEKQKEALSLEQQEIGKEHQQYVELQNKWNQTYLEWKLTTEQNIKEIAFFIEEAVFPADEKAELTEEVPSLSPHLLEEINGSIEELKHSKNQKKNRLENYSLFKQKKKPNKSSKRN